MKSSIRCLFITIFLLPWSVSELPAQITGNHPGQFFTVEKDFENSRLMDIYLWRKSGQKSRCPDRNV